MPMYVLVLVFASCLDTEPACVPQLQWIAGPFTYEQCKPHEREALKCVREDLL